MNRKGIWSQEETELLKTQYAKTTNKELKTLFPNRSFKSLYKKAKSLGLKRLDEIEYKNRSEGREWSHNKTINPKGYVLVYDFGHPRADRYGRVFEHIIVWEKANNRQVPEGCIVHHINECKADNRIENLQLMSISEHIIHHNKNRKLSDETKSKISKANKRKCAGEKHPLYKKVDILKMREEIADGETVESVCKKFNINKTTYYKKLKNQGEV